VDADVRSVERRTPWGSRSRLILLVILGAYLLAVPALGGRAQWTKLGVAAGPFAFWDLRSITSGWECSRRGIDVLATDTNPCDPTGRSFDYPRIWMSLAFLGLGQGDTVKLGILLATVFLVTAVAVLPSRSPPYEAVLYGVALCSPAVMLGVERGNIDMLAFVLVALAVLLFRRNERSTILAHALMLLAAVIKLFPIFAAGVLLRQRPRRALIGFGAVVASFLIYAFVIRSDIRLLERNVPQGDTLSYGLRAFSQWLAAGAGSIAGKHSLRGWDNAVTAAIIAATLLAYRGGRGRLPRVPGPAAQRDFDLFVAGAGVYVGTYYLVRSFDYRQAFLLLTLPQLLRWARDRRPLAFVSLTALFGSLWFDAYSVRRVPLLGSAMRRWNELSTFAPFDRPLPAAAIMQLILFAGLIGCLACTIPWRSRLRSNQRK
jgi:hypothetical protein